VGSVAAEGGRRKVRRAEGGRRKVRRVKEEVSPFQKKKKKKKKK
jgi:hypothetical protein